MKKTILIISALVVFALLGCKNKTTENKESKCDIDLKNFSFIGTEPFWDLKFEEDNAVYNSPMEEKTTMIFYKKSKGDEKNVKLSEAIVKVSDNEYKIWAVMEKSNLEITITKENCSDDMTPTKYSYKILLVFDESTTIYGCGNCK